MPTDNDWRVLRAIIRTIVRTNHRPPKEAPCDSEVSCTLSLMDIADGAGVYPGNVRRYVRRLEERGLLRREHGAGSRPTIYYMTLAALSGAHILLDAVVGMDGPWPSRDSYKY